MGNYTDDKREIKALFNAPEYRPMKYAAIAVIAAVIVIQLVTIIWLDDMSDRVLHVMRIFAGVGALVFAVIVAVITYKVYAEHLRRRYDKSRRRN